MLEITGEQPGTLADMDMAKRMAETLLKHYPGHLWGVNCNHQTGIATVFNLNLSGRWGFTMKLDQLHTDPGLKKVINAGGEVLERYRMRRGQFDEAQYDQMKTDFAGNFKADM